MENEVIEEVEEQTEEQKPEFVIDLNNMPKQEHRWVDRGLIISCENGGHPYHQVHKRL